MDQFDFDPISAVEALYRVDQPGSSWIHSITQALAPLVDAEENGIFAGFYDCPDAMTFAPIGLQVHGARDALCNIFATGIGQLNPTFVSNTFLVSGAGNEAEIPGWEDIPPVKDGSLAALGFTNAFTLRTCELDGRGACLAAFGTLRAIGARQRRLLASVQKHFVAANRLHRKVHALDGSPLGAAAAVLDSDGRVHHAEGPAREPEFRERLSRAVRDSETARGRRRRDDPLGALSAWESLVSNRWTFVDHIEHGGRRYLLALENEAARPSLKFLSPREREVLRRAAAGSHNKAIAYDLGLSHATVRVLISRAARKLGVRTRIELLAFLKTAFRQGALDPLDNPASSAEGRS